MMFLQMDFKKRAKNKNFSEIRWNIEKEEKKINISFTYFLIKIHIFRIFLCCERERERMREGLNQKKKCNNNKFRNIPANAKLIK